MSEDFFGLDLANIEKVLAKLEKAIPSAIGLEKELMETCFIGLKWAINEDVKLDRNDSYFARNHARGFDNAISGLLSEGLELEHLFWAFFCLYAYFFEIRLVKDSFNDEELKLHSLFESLYKELPTNFQFRIDYLRHKLPQRIFIDLGKKQLAALETKSDEYLTQLNALTSKIEGWNGELTNWGQRVSDIQALLKDKAQELNFVGLAKAFSDQIQSKNREKWIQILVLGLLGIGLVTVPFLGISLTENADSTTESLLTYLRKLVPFAVTELVLFYWFRIFLKNFYSVKAQLLQLSLRHSLCAFVESYAEFISKLRKDAGEAALDRFEALIFSGITPDPEDVPSQFDGLEQVARFVKELRGGTKS